MIVEFVDGTTADCIAFTDSYGRIGGSIKTVDGYLSCVKGCSHIAVITEYGNPDSYTKIYPIDKVLCIHKDISTLRDKKIDSIVD